MPAKWVRNTTDRGCSYAETVETKWRIVFFFSFLVLRKNQLNAEENGCIDFLYG